MKNKRTPDIRFPGFTGDWELRNLGNISTKIGSGKTPKGGDQNYKSEGIPLLRSQNIFNDKVNINDVVYITPEIDEDMANSRVQKGDVLLNITGASIGRSAVYKLNHKANVNQHVSIIRPSSEVDPYFIQLNITSEKGQKQIELNQAGGGREGLNFQQIAKMGFYFPTLVEQSKIRDFFIQLDNTIVLHQQELTTLKQTKQGFLQKMFPKEGESVPEVRFPGFTGDWEQRKFGEGTLKIGDGLHGTPQYSANGNIAFINGNNLVNGKIMINSQTKYVTSDQQSHDDKELNQNTILMSINGTIGNLAWYNGEKVMLGKSAAYIEVSSFDKNFVYQLLQTSKIKSYFLNNLTGTTIKNLGLKTIRETPTLVPKIDEQKKIGQFLKQLDDTIALHQLELDALKETKKACLQKMLV